MNLSDRYGRPLTYLRLSVTDACNLRCFYCMPGGERKCPAEGGLRRGELVRLVRIALSLGIRKVRITGGEPLVRKDIVEVVRDISSLSGIDDLSLTTNGVLLSRLAAPLKMSGLGRVNVSLDTLDPGKFSRITGRAEIGEIFSGLEEAGKVGFSPLKINVVVLRGVNDNELQSFLDFGRDRGVVIRFIEFMPVAKGREWRERFMSREEILARLGGRIDTSVVPFGKPGEPAKYYTASDGTVFGIISPVSHSFCDGCSRMRIAANGRLLACIAEKSEVDLAGPMRSGASDDDIRELFLRAASLKPRRTALDRPIDSTPMYQIGG